MEAAGKTTRTLADRLAQGRLPVREVLRYALLLAEALRRIHDSGVVHGGLSPACVNLTPDGIELMPARDDAAKVTRYTAPEVLMGRPAGTRADIFAFGSMFFEMATGRPAFAGSTAMELASAICSGALVSTGNPVLDRVIGPCLARDPALRCPRAQRVLLELKLLVIALRRRAPRQQRGNSTAALQEHLLQMEARLTARLERIERGIQEIRDRFAVPETR